ncbi:hypothetical protein [Rhodonellum sp.]|uniref:hypothetical protein n=1 Tax=Rhodonellum sp. TaxID=2231180 RepID=UPI0027246F9A|nr:hypothetical protein [Rhodonellum sp.]MDO9550950.1 hypothetical protein [Rhodonellum sp.]
MKDFSKNTKSDFKFSLEESDLPDHDYFLMNFHPENAVQYLRATLVKKGQLKAEIFLSVNDAHEAISIPNAPFGGFWIHESTSSESISFFIETLIISLKQRNVTSITAIQAPLMYCHHSDLVGYLLHSAGFEAKRILNHQFFEGKKKLKKFSLELVLKYQKKTKSLGLQVMVGNIQNFGFLKEIRSWNQYRGYVSNISESRLVQQVSSFPERYFVITIWEEGKAIAHALAVKLTSDSLYYYLSAIDPKSQSKIAGELIMVHLLKLAAEQKVSFLDLGSSDLEGQPNHSLMFFKSKFSNASENKIFWHKTI